MGSPDKMASTSSSLATAGHSQTHRKTVCCRTLQRSGNSKILYMAIWWTHLRKCLIIKFKWLAAKKKNAAKIGWNFQINEKLALRFRWPLTTYMHTHSEHIRANNNISSLSLNKTIYQERYIEGVQMSLIRQLTKMSSIKTMEIGGCAAIDYLHFNRNRRKINYFCFFFFKNFCSKKKIIVLIFFHSLDRIFYKKILVVFNWTMRFRICILINSINKPLATFFFSVRLISAKTIHFEGSNSQRTSGIVDARW